MAGTTAKSVLASDGPPREEADGDVHNDADDLEVNQKKLSEAWEKVNKPDPWPQQFAKTLRARQEAVIKRLKEIKEKSALDTQTFDTEIAPLICAALGGLTDDTPDPASFSFPIQVQYLGAEGQTYCDAMINLMKQSGALVLAYDELAGRQTHFSRLGEIGTSFKKDKEVTVSTIEAGKKVASTEIEQLLTDRFQEVRAPYDLTGEEEHKGRLLLSRGTDQGAQSRRTLGWGNVATDAEEAIGRLCFAGKLHVGDR